MPARDTDFAAPFFDQRERSLNRIDKNAAQASAIAEALGYYTPELQRVATQPIGNNPTVGENIIGAPIRGLGKLFGSETLQGVGQVQPANLGQAQQLRAPQLPAGTPPELAQQLQGMASQLGYGPAMQRDTIPNIPSETSASPLMRTDGQRRLEEQLKGKVWDKIIENYQTAEQRKLAQVEIEAKQQDIKYKQALGKQALAYANKGPDITASRQIEAQWNNMNEKRALEGLPPLLRSDVAKLFKANTSTPNRTIETYEWAKENGQLEIDPNTGKEEDIARFTNRIKKSGGDLFDMMFRAYMGSDAVYIRQPEQWVPDVVDKVEQFGQLMKDRNDQRRAEREAEQNEKKYTKDGVIPLMEDMPIPQELLAQGVTEEDIQAEMEDEGISRVEAIEKLMRYLEQARNLRRGGR